MAMVVTESCKGCKDKACVSVCPCDCFYEDAEMVYINPDECIDCYGCIPVCPVEAIFYQDDVPAQLRHYIELNATRSKECPPAQLE